MRFIFAALAAFSLAACTQPAAPPASESEAEAPALPAITGQFTAMSTTAMSITGDVDVQPDVLSFGKGFRIEGGRIDAALGPDTDLSAGGGTIASGSGNTGVQAVEVRRVDQVRVAADAADPQLCGAGVPLSHVILANGAETLSVLVFSGADAPGPNAHDTQLCGIYNFSPREG